MQLRTGQWDYQEVLDTYELERMVNEAMPGFPMVRVFVDTIDETDRLKTFIDREGYTALIVHIPTSEFDKQENKMEYAKQKVVEAMHQLKIAA